MDILQDIRKDASENISRSDSKAAFTLAFNGALLASLGFNARLINGFGAEAIFWLVSSAIFIVSSIFLLISIVPRIAADEASDFSFVKVAQMKNSDFIRMIKRYSEDANDILAEHTIMLTKLARKKFKYVSLGMLLTIAGAINWIVFFALIISSEFSSA